MSNAIQRVEDRASSIIKSQDFGSTILGGLPSWVDPDRFRTAALVALTEPDVAKTSPRSQVEAMMACAQMGLVPGADKHVYLFPRGSKLCADPSARGFRFLAERQPGIESVEARLVMVGDVFEHAPNPDFPGEFIVTRLEPGGGFFGSREIKYHADSQKAGCLGGYVHVRFSNGSQRFHRVPWATIFKNSQASRSSKFWNDWTAQMAEKTLYRDAWSRGVLRGNGYGAAAIGRAFAIHDELHGGDQPAATSSKVNALLAAKREPVESEVVEPEVEDDLPGFDDQPAFGEDGGTGEQPDYLNMGIRDLVASIAGRFDAEFDAVFNAAVEQTAAKATTPEKLSVEDADRVRSWCLGELGVSE